MSRRPLYVIPVIMSPDGPDWESVLYVPVTSAAAAREACRRAGYRPMTGRGTARVDVAGVDAYGDDWRAWHVAVHP